MEKFYDSLMRETFMTELNLGRLFIRTSQINKRKKNTKSTHPLLWVMASSVGLDRNLAVVHFFFYFFQVVAIFDHRLLDLAEGQPSLVSEGQIFFFFTKLVGEPISLVSLVSSSWT